MKETEQRTSYKWLSMFVVSVGTFIITLDSGIVRIVLPHLGDVFHAGPNAVVWVLLIYLLVGTGLMLSLGQAGDTFGRKRLYAGGLAIFTLGLGLCSLARSLIQLVMFRLIQAVGAAMAAAVGNAIITASFPARERGRALGIKEAVVGAGLLSGPALGGFLLDRFGWQSIFYLRLPFGIIALAMAWVLLKEQPLSKREEKFDLAGAASLFFALTFLLLAVNRGQSLGWTSPWVVGLSVGGLLLLLFFLIVERKVVQPVLDLKFFQSRLFSAASASHVFLYMLTSAVNFLMPFYLIQGLGFGASKAGVLLITGPAVSLVVSPLSGRLSDKLGTFSLCALGVALVSVGLLLLSSLRSSVPLTRIVLYLIILGVGMALFITPNTSAIMGSVPGERLGTASAMVGTLRQVGMSIGLAIAGSVFAASQFSHGVLFISQGLSEDVTQRLCTISGFHDTLLVLLPIAVVGLVASVCRGKK